MKYNILFESSLGGGYNLTELDENKLLIVIDAYKCGKSNYTIAGKSYTLTKIINFQIFTHEKQVNFNDFQEYCIKQEIIKSLLSHYWYSEECLKLIGKNVTEKFVADNPFGYKAIQENKKLLADNFVNQSRIEELKVIHHPDFDLCRLIKLCEEINLNYKHQNFLSVGMIGRTILNHIPPIFTEKNFDQVASNYGGKSFKNNMQLLNGYFKNTVDSYLHQTIRKTDSLPNAIQVEFRQPLDVLLEEIVRRLHVR